MRADIAKRFVKTLDQYPGEYLLGDAGHKFIIYLIKGKKCLNVALVPLTFEDIPVDIEFISEVIHA